MACYGHGTVLFLLLLSTAVNCQESDQDIAYESSMEELAFCENHNFDGRSDIPGKRWAVLVAGSNGYANYAQQADVCHAYQILKKGGLKDENIIVFMYDDIAFNKDNPRPGIIINKPNGSDVYAGVPKDYTGNNCTADNLYAVILGDRTSLTGGSGKVLDTNPNDHIFIFYSDHGSAGTIGMPVGQPVYANDLTSVLKMKHEARSFERMVFYLDACDAGSMFEGLLPNDINVYAVTSSKAHEDSWDTYCSSSSDIYNTCFGGLFSVSWMEDSDAHDLREETLKEQYETVKKRTGNPGEINSHVMRYGDLRISEDYISLYMGPKPANDNNVFTEDTSLPSSSPLLNKYDADLFYWRDKYFKAPKGSSQKMEAEKKLVEEINNRQHVDYTMNKITTLLFGHEKGLQVLKSIRSPGQPLVDDWHRFKKLVKTYEKYCGVLSRYGKKNTRAMANMCNAGINVEQMKMASIEACAVTA